MRTEPHPTTRVLSRLPLALALLAGVVSVALALAPRAEAARDLDVGFADYLYGSTISEDARELWAERTVDANATIVRINLYWRSVATRKPADPRDPGDPAYNWNTIDAAVRNAESHGLDVLLTSFAAPDWAEGPNRPKNVNPGSWKPDPKAYTDFAHAIAERYSGTFGGSNPLPEVEYFQAWNEPNLSTYITPQWKGKKNESSELYVALLNAFYDEVKAVNPDATIVSGGTSPYGDPPGGPNRTQPLRFLQEILCLTPKDKRGKCTKAGKAKAVVFSLHPINREDPPRAKAAFKGDIEIADFHSLTKALKKAERYKTVGTGGKHQFWADEVWWQTNPPDKKEGVSLKTHARWTAEGLSLLWKQGASKVIFLQFRDAKYTPGEPSLASYQTGVYTYEGKRKPSYDAVKFPFVTERKGKKLKAWGIAPESGKLKIEAKGKGGYRKVGSVNAKEGRVFTDNLRVKGNKLKLRAKVGGETSLVWKQGKKNK
jgi:hypothetical protein